MPANMKASSAFQLIWQIHILIKRIRQQALQCSPEPYNRVERCLAMFLGGKFAAFDFYFGSRYAYRRDTSNIEFWFRLCNSRSSNEVGKWIDIQQSS